MDIVYRRYHTNTQCPQSNSVSAKPLESKSVTARPLESNSVSAKSLESKYVTAKPLEANSVSAKPLESNGSVSAKLLESVNHWSLCLPVKPLRESVSAKSLVSNYVSATLSHTVTGFERVWSAAFGVVCQVAACMQGID